MWQGSPNEINISEDISGYVADLQLHMTLQARNLLPPLAESTKASNSREQLLQDTQAQLEKIVSRQRIQ